MHLSSVKSRIEYGRWRVFSRRNLSNDDLFFGLHIHKTAGMSLLWQAKDQLDEGRHYINSMYALNYREKITELEERTQEDLNTIRFVFGHHINEYMLNYFPQKRVRLFTFLRDPIARVRSWYFFYRRLMEQHQQEVQPFSTFYANFYPHHSLCSMLTSGFPSFIDSTDDPPYLQALSILRKFYFVSTLDDFSAKAPKLFRKIGLRYFNVKSNQTDYDMEPDFEDQLDYDILHQDNEQDIQLYNEIQTRGRKGRLNYLGFDKKGFEESMNTIFTKEHNPALSLYNNHSGPIKGNYQLENIYSQVMDDYRSEFDSIPPENTWHYQCLLIKLFALEERPERRQLYKKTLIEMGKTMNWDLRGIVPI